MAIAWLDHAAHRVAEQHEAVPAELVDEGQQVGLEQREAVVIGPGRVVAGAMAPEVRRHDVPPSFGRASRQWSAKSSFAPVKPWTIRRGRPPTPASAISSVTSPARTWRMVTLVAGPVINGSLWS